MGKVEGSGPSASPASQNGEAGNTEQKLERLLAVAAGLMAMRGYGQTSIRNVAKETGFSLAGMYYYFENKEDLLFQIQHRTFASLLKVQEEVVAAGDDAEVKFRNLVGNHLSYFTSHFSELKVCTFELESLQGERYRTIEALRRRYFACMAEVVAQLMGQAGPQNAPDGRVRQNTLFIFGMLNWIFMWFDPARDGSTEDLGDAVIDLILPGLHAER